MTEIVDQPSPVSSGVISDPVWMMTVQDMVKRAGLGKNRYGTYLYPFNGRNALVDMYQEILDAAVYARQAIYEMDRVRDAAAQIMILLDEGAIKFSAESKQAVLDFEAAMKVLSEFTFHGGEHNVDRD